MRSRPGRPQGRAARYRYRSAPAPPVPALEDRTSDSARRRSYRAGLSRFLADGPEAFSRLIRPGVLGTLALFLGGPAADEGPARTSERSAVSGRLKVNDHCAVPNFLDSDHSRT